MSPAGQGDDKGVNPYTCCRGLKISAVRQSHLLQGRSVPLLQKMSLTQGGAKESMALGRWLLLNSELN